jgi:hypothetical protein
MFQGGNLNRVQIGDFFRLQLFDDIFWQIEFREVAFGRSFLRFDIGSYFLELVVFVVVFGRIGGSLVETVVGFGCFVRIFLEFYRMINNVGSVFNLD